MYYVNDIIMIGNHNENIAHTKGMLGKKFKMTYLGLMYFYLSIEVWQEPCQICISQQKYAKEILKAFGMDECKIVGNPNGG